MTADYPVGVEGDALDAEKEMHFIIPTVTTDAPFHPLQ